MPENMFDDIFKFMCVGALLLVVCGAGIGYAIAKSGLL